jgi:UDP-glucose 4-epimerase
MKIVITGALGHIGSYLIRSLPLDFPEAKFILVDNMLTQRFSSLFNLSSNFSYKFIDGDINKIDLNEIFHNVNFVIHLAAITDAAGSFDNAEVLEKNNFGTTKRIAEACVESCSKLITLSSTSVYGTNGNLVSEECSIGELKPQSPYAKTKLKEEQFVQKLFNEKNLDVVTFRFGTIFGSSVGMRFHTAVNKFCWQASMGQPITVWSTAYDQKRPYLDLKDAVSAISFVIKKDIFDGKIYNVLTHNLTVRNITDTIKSFVPNIEIDFVESKIMNQLSYEVSNERFKNKGFSYYGNFRQGIEDTILLLKNTNSF